MSPMSAYVQNRVFSREFCDSLLPSFPPSFASVRAIGYRMATKRQSEGRTESRVQVWAIAIDSVSEGSNG
jgi:hypothetical protein